ncbi:dTMP kinase [Natronomonas gomsonensis]|mgnify:CR=1 FL=1|jgi:dTMP kinase|uniref:dTMP kinase n=1 Tax=Natronomonas gomsonensis TaxID=1046043 RepID=UPI0020CA544A|nr:dTMP kinase [Natronomonas gomsonensis]MCY4730892.1 dTMP kinase [Natronomonas gomsonensis]
MLITLEGIDGSGKTTVREALADSHPEAVFTREPTESWYGEAVNRSINDDAADPMAELFLYTADHADHLSRVVRPALNEGKTVISDRYSDSRYAYQGATLSGVVKQPMAYIKGVHEPFTRKPDATLYFDVPPKTGADRAGATNKFEAADYLEAVQQNYERLIDAEPNRFVRIDATQSPEEVIASAERVVADLLD